MIASTANPVGDVRNARKEKGRGSTTKRTFCSCDAFMTLFQVAEFDVVLLGAGVPAGTTIFTWLLESDPPARVMFIPGVENGTEPSVWKRPIIVKLVLLAASTFGWITNPLRVVL